jgi:hypothetical protein
VRKPLLLHLADARDPWRLAVGPALAAAAERAGWRFDAYHDAFRLGRHFGGGDPAEAVPGSPAGGLAAGGRHLERVAALTAAYAVAVVGDPDAALWATLERAGAEVLARTADPVALYRAVHARLDLPVPARALVVDGAPQGRHGVVTAPYAFPAFLVGEPVLGVEVGASEERCAELEALGVTAFAPLSVDPGRAARFPRPLDLTGDEAAADRTDAEVTAALAHRHAGWGRGILLGDPDLVAAQLPRAARLRLLPLYGRPQTDVLARCADLVRDAAEPVYGRQHDDHDFVALARLGHGLQVLDPAPPFDAAVTGPARRAASSPDPAAAAGLADRRAVPGEPDDAELLAWAAEGRVLCTLLLWSGMVRELDCLPPLLDVVAATGLHAGLVVTVDTVAHDLEPVLDLLDVPPERGGVRGLLEVVVGSTGRGVAAEGLLPDGVLARELATARAAIADRLPPGTAPLGWWPLLDTPLVPHRAPRVERRGLRPVLRFTPRAELAARPDPSAAGDGAPGDGPPQADAAGGRRLDARALAGAALRGSGLINLFEPARPFDDARPGDLDPRVLEAVAAAGFAYQWTKAAFGAPAIVARRGDVVALPWTAGAWDGWSPFYTVGTADDLAAAERRLLRSGRPGWLASTVDSPLWAMSGEVIRHGGRLHDLAALAAAGGRSGRLVCTTPNVVARYARLLDREGLLGPAAPPA